MILLQQSMHASYPTFVNPDKTLQRAMCPWCMHPCWIVNLVPCSVRNSETKQVWTKLGGWSFLTARPAYYVCKTCSRAGPCVFAKPWLVLRSISLH